LRAVLRDGRNADHANQQSFSKRSDDTGDKSATKPTDEIEVTPDVIEAWFRVVVESRITEFPLEADKLTVEEISRAMRSVALAKEARNCS